MSAQPWRGVRPWRMPFPSEGTERSRRVKWLTIHFIPLAATVGPPPIVEVADFIIRWDRPTDIYDNAAGIIDERTGMWIPGHAIRKTPAGLTHPDFARASIGEKADPNSEEEPWDLWQ